jgi:hypothetical protein
VELVEVVGETLELDAVELCVITVTVLVEPPHAPRQRAADTMKTPAMNFDMAPAA